VLRTSLDEEVAVEIERPSEEVWAFVSDFERLPEWLEEFEAVVKKSDGPVGRGTVYRYTLSPATARRPWRLPIGSPNGVSPGTAHRFAPAGVGNDPGVSARLPRPLRAAPVWSPATSRS
jgi:polyketide cyclase/dehydrase/lipid transport protein